MVYARELRESVWVGIRCERLRQLEGKGSMKERRMQGLGRVGMGGEGFIKCAKAMRLTAGETLERWLS